MDSNAYIKEKADYDRIMMQSMAACNQSLAQEKKNEKQELPPIGDIFYNRKLSANHRLLNEINAKQLEEQVSEFKIN